MRHNVYGRHLGRDKNQRTALFKSLVQALFLYETIETTQAKAKAIKGLVDKLINQAKSSNARLIDQFVLNKSVSQKLKDDIILRFDDRNSGYTSITRLGPRLGDGAMMVQMRLVEGSKKKPKVKDQKLTKEIKG